MRLPVTNHINLIGRLCLVVVCLIFLGSSSPAIAANRTGDEFLVGYITSILERDLLWGKESYRLEISNGMAVITIFKDSRMRRRDVNKQLKGIDGLKGVEIVVLSPDDIKTGGIKDLLKITNEAELFPIGDFFKPLIADPKQPQFFVSFNRFRSSSQEFTMASVGFGENFGMYSLLGEHEGNGLQISLQGGLFAQFNMDTPSSDLINADYIIGIPLTYRHDNDSIRLRIYHQSSHLGDELLQGDNPPERINLSYEAVELIYSHEWPEWRIYGGGEYIIQKEPKNLEPIVTHWGIEYYGSEIILWNGRPVAGVDIKGFEDHGPDTSVKAGLEFGRRNPGERRLRLMAEWYNGLDPRGQFYNNRVEYYGLGTSLGF